MTMSAKEKQVIKNVIRRLKAQPREDGFPPASPEIVEKLSETYLKIYLDTWVTGALQCLLEDENGERNVDLALRLSD